MRLDLESPLIGLACAASTHGITDAAYSPQTLWPYAVLMLPIPRVINAYAFCVASVVHFGYDIGLVPSALLHAGLFALASKDRGLASSVGCLYYTAIHVPIHLRRHWDETPLARAALAGSALLLPWTHRIRHVSIPRAAQRLVIGHVGVDFLERDRRRHCLHDTT